MLVQSTPKGFRGLTARAQRRPFVGTEISTARTRPNPGRYAGSARLRRTTALRGALACLLAGTLLVAPPGTAAAQRESRVATVTFRLQATRASNGRIAGQIVGSLLAAAIVGWTAWAVVDNPEGSDRRVKGDAGYTPNANTAYAVGSFVGSTVAAYLIGRGDGSRGSLGATALGAGIPSIALAFGRHEPYLQAFGVLFGAPLQAVGATIGYQRTRREP